MVWDFGIFIGDALRAMFPNTFFLAFMCVAMVAALMLTIRAPASFTIMVGFVLFALIAGGSMVAGIPSLVAGISIQFMPFLILMVVLIGGAIAYAFWRIFGY